MRLSSRRRVIPASLSLVLVAVLALAGSSASAVTGGPGAPQTLPASDSSTWQTDNSVWALAYSNHVVFAAGDFTHICAPGTPASSCSTPMGGIAAFHADGTGVGTPCTAASPCPGVGAWLDPKVVGRVYALSVTPDGTKLYAAGDLSSADGVKHGKIVGYDLTRTTTRSATRQLPTPSAVGQVRALATTNDYVFVGGGFTSMKAADGTAFNQPHLASFTTADGVLRTDWAPPVDDTVFALLPGPGADSANLVLGGKFRNVDNNPHSGVAQVAMSDGSDGPMSNTIVPGNVGTTHSDVKALTTDSDGNLYVGAEGTGYGIFDGTASVNPVDGTQIWKSPCLGATQAIAVLNNALYIGSHAHDCASLPNGGFGQLPFVGDDRSWHHLIAEQARPDSTPSSGGQLLNWYPNVNNGPDPLDQTHLGPRAMATDGTTLWVGGEFTTVNGKAQRGLTRFIAGPDTTPPAPTRPTYTDAAAPTATSPAPGQVTLRFPGFSDPDDRTLSYAITRDGLPVTGPTTPDTSANVDSPFWKTPDYVYRDTNVPPGSHTYTITATDAEGQSGSVSASVTVASAATGGFPSNVLASSPSLYWRLNETGGTAAADSSPNNRVGTYFGSPTFSRPGAIAGNNGLGVSNGRGVAATGKAAAPTDYTLDTWIRVDPTNHKGGRILGFNTSAGATTGTGNRALYMLNSGQIAYSILTSDGSTCHFGIPYAPVGSCYVFSKQSLNDGTWHHIVATQSSTAGMVLYIDGMQVASENEAPAMKPKAVTGVWQAGVISTFTSAPQFSSKPGTLNGDIDEVAVYPTPLTANQVAGQWTSAE